MENNDINYKLGMFYVNRYDNRIFVPKRSGLGWTFNFANKWTYVCIALIIAIIVSFKHYHFGY